MAAGTLGPGPSSLHAFSAPPWDRATETDASASATMTNGVRTCVLRRLMRQDLNRSKQLLQIQRERLPSAGRLPAHTRPLDARTLEGGRPHLDQRRIAIHQP